MITPDQISQLHDHVTSANSIIILLGPQPKADYVYTAVSLFQALQGLGKSVELACPEDIQLAEYSLMGDVECRQKIGNQNLSISFDYDEVSVDKVSYHIDEEQQKFYLIVKPQKGHPPLKAESVSFDYTGADAELVFLVGVHQLESLEHLYQGYEDLFNRATVVTVHTFEPQIGSLKLNVSGTSSMSEAMGRVLFQLAPELVPDAATNLLSGIEHATEHLQSLTATAQTFETVAELMKRGARRLRPAAKNVEAREKQSQNRKPENKSTEVVLRQENAKKTPFAEVMSQKGEWSNRGKAAPPKLSPASEPKPGSLNYQPTGFGPGGAG
ncbi:MAG TPA: hypothetical protein VF209_05425 [Patescibacteria group bacterium]